SELSTNAANYFASGLKGRFKEADRNDDHSLASSTYPVLRPESGRIAETEQPARLSLNEALRDSYIDDCERALARWNKILREMKIDADLKLPHRGFNRSIGEFSEVSVTPDGRIVSRAQWDEGLRDWMPTASDREFVASLMKPETRPGRLASWIAPPLRGINHQPLDFAYVRAF
ncbi:MAG TPA: hypothetical protein VEJ86_11800, partial [Candidatus Binataceae bacterium]|nr:hypothetical protein [Candidatus Binataceae bacterium]